MKIRKEKEYRIYALIVEKIGAVFVGKSWAKDLKPLYDKHLYGKYYLTKEYFSTNQFRHQLFVLENFCRTTSDAYRHVIAWCRYFEDKGYLLLNHDGTKRQSKFLYPQTEEIFERINQQPLTDVLALKHSFRGDDKGECSCEYEEENETVQVNMRSKN